MGMSWTDRTWTDGGGVALSVFPRVGDSRGFPVYQKIPKKVGPEFVLRWELTIKCKSGPNSIRNRKFS